MRIVMVIGALVALGLLAVLRPARAPAITSVTGSAQAVAAGPSSTPRPTPSIPATLVYVAGEVVHPGVYAIAGDARVGDAVTRAGGLRPGADPTAVNLAAHVRDGDEILVAARGAAAPASGHRRRGHGLRRRSHGRARERSSEPGESAPSAAVDLNAADAATLGFRGSGRVWPSGSSRSARPTAPSRRRTGCSTSRGSPIDGSSRRCPTSSCTDARATMRGAPRVVQSMNPRTASVLAADDHSVPAVWSALRAGAERVAVHEPALEVFARRVVLSQASFTDALAGILAAKLAGTDFAESELALLATTVLRHEPQIVASAAHDLAASVERDPAYRDAFTPFAYAKGFHALEWQRIAHALWCGGREEIATFLEGRANDAFGIDIHPGARIGRGVFIDHGTGIVIGETAVVGDDVSMLHGVTLGGTGKESGDRHPKIGNGVLLGAGATVLGNVQVGAGARIAAGSVVLREVAPHTTVAGVPAHLVGATRGEDPAQSMDQDFTDFQI